MKKNIPLLITAIIGILLNLLTLSQKVPSLYIQSWIVFIVAALSYFVYFVSYFYKYSNSPKQKLLKCNAIQMKEKLIFTIALCTCVYLFLQEKILISIAWTILYFIPLIFRLHTSSVDSNFLFHIGICANICSMLLCKY